MKNILWYALIAISLLYLIEPIVKAISLSMSGAELGWVVNPFVTTITMLTIGIIVADFIRPIPLLRKWPGKFLVMIAILSALFDAITHLQFLLRTASSFENAVELQVVTFNRGWDIWNVLLEATLLISVYLSIFLPHKSLKQNSIEEVFS